MAAAVVAELSAVSMRLRSKKDELRWTAPESWHITLQFLGNTEPQEYECLAARLRNLHLPAIPIQLEGFGFFDRSGIFNAEVQLTAELLSLQQRVLATSALCGFAPEARPFHPHITLARSKGEDRSRGLRELKSRVGRQPAFSRFVAEEFLLYESFLGPAGSRYEVRERFPLQGP